MASGFPRRLILDFVGEYIGAVKGATETYTLLETVDALRKARRRGPTWTVTACLDPDDVPELLTALAPVGVASDYGFSRAVGGLVIECGEVDLIAPNQGTISPEVRTVFQRGRHHSISILVATQRPASVNRIVTSQADVICAFRQHEPRDADYLGEVMRAEAPDIVRTLPQFHYLRYLVNFGLLETVNGAGQVVREHVTAAV
jgi:hypothetical protein